VLYDFGKPCGLFYATKWIAKSHPRILMYHRISGTTGNGEFPVDVFRSQIKTLKKWFNPVSISQLISSFSVGRSIQNAVVVTFDDGYYDFAEYAFPILQEEGVPVTLFATTGFINDDLWLWPDQILYALESCERRPICVDGIKGLSDSNLNNKECWNIIADHCLTLSSEKRDIVIRNLYRSLDLVIPSRAPERFRPLSWSQIKDMQKFGLTVGSHSYSHPVLSKLSDQQIYNELNLSKEMIERNLDCSVEGFCYPNGMKCDFDCRVKSTLIEIGYKWAVTAYPTPSPLADLFEISRYSAGASMEQYFKTVFGLKYLSMRFSS